MVVDLTPEQEILVLQTARHEGRSVQQIVLDTLQWLAQTEVGDRASVQRGLDQANRGEFVDQAEVERRFARMHQP